MGKFKNWLIHKLGGYTVDDMKKASKPINVTLNNRRVQSIYAVKSLDAFEMNAAPNWYKNWIENSLKDELFDKVLKKLKEDYKPELIYRFDDNLGIQNYTIVFEYLEPHMEKRR